MELPFDPTLAIGPVRVAWHSLWSLVGMIAGSWLSFRLARRLVKDERIWPFAIAVFVGGLLAARIGHIADNWPFYSARPDQLAAFWNGGAAVTAAPIGSAIGGYLAAKRLRLPIGFMFDITVIGIVLGEAIGRIGDIINGEHWATACSGVAWCVRYTAPNSPGQREYVHPAVAYELVCDLAITALLLVLLPWSDRQRRHPQLPFVFLGLYGAARLALSAFRLDPLFAFGMSQAQLVSIAFVALAIGALLWLRRDGPHPAVPSR